MDIPFPANVVFWQGKYKDRDVAVALHAYWEMNKLNKYVDTYDNFMEVKFPIM